MRAAYPHFCACFRRKDDTASNFAIPAGIRHKSCASFRRTTYRYAFPTIIMRRRLGGGPQTSCMLEGMVPADDTRDTTQQMPYRDGSSLSVRGKRKGVT